MTRARVARAMLGSLLAVVLFAGCGGKQNSDTTPTTGGGDERAERARGGDMVPPEKMDEINRILERKGKAVSRCLTMAVDNKELPKNSAGKITVELVIEGGKVTSIKVVRATLESKMLTECVLAKVREIEFPQLPKPYETSYTYGFEAM
jgi:hypothetical protein